MRNLITYVCFCVFGISFCQIQKVDNVTISKSTHAYKIVKKDTLKLDFYQSVNLEKQSPLLLFVHGGGFASGKHNEAHIVQFCKTIAQNGFAVASISYRLTMKNVGLGCNVKAKNKIKAFNDASDDISHAVTFLINNKKNFNIDSDKIILSGVSSGAEAVLNLAYAYDTTILPKDFKFAGLISMTGALISLDKLNKTSAIPTQLFHGTNDNLVPYYIAAHHFCNEDDPGHLLLFGSRAIADRLKGLGANYYLITNIGEPHQRSSGPMQYNIDDILDFLINDVLNKKSRQTERTIRF